MAKFQKVMREFDRMCKANKGCFNCPLHERDGVSYRCNIGAFVNDSERIEHEVMSWAAEHPEPVYPTWEEWLITQDVIKENPNGVGWPMLKLFERIPADIAEKLGLQPKENE